MDMGETLRFAREQQGLSLDVISQRTKINTEKLRAIEENDIQKLPSGIFLRGFLRAYARELGLDVEDTVNRYVAQFESEASIAEDVPLEETVEEAPDEISETQRIEESLREMSMWGVVAIVVLSLGLLAYMTLRSPSVSPAPTVARAEAPPVVAPPPAFAMPVPTAPPLPADNVVPPPLPSESGSAVSPLAPVSVATASPPPAPVTAVTPRSTPEETGTAGVQEPPVVQNSNTIELTIETVGPCWVEAIVDGQTVIYAMMQEGERQRIERGNDVVLRVGDPAAFTYSINGVAGKPIGQPGTASSVHITTENYHEFIITEPAPSACGVSLDESARPQLGVGLPQLLFGVHHNWAAPRDRLLNRFARDEQKTDPVVARLHHYLIAPIEQHQKPVRDVGESTIRVACAHAIGHRFAWFGPVTKSS